MSIIKTVSTHDLKEWIENKNIHLIDVRNHNEQLQGKIDNSTIIPLHLIPLELSRIRMMKDDIVFYCRTGARSAQACMFLNNHQITNVFSLQGGIESWLKHKI